MSDIRFRFVAPSDLPSILELFRKAYPGRTIPERYYRWQFFETPVLPLSSVVAMNGNRIVAHAGYTARVAKLNGCQSILFIKQTSMSDPTVRGSGIYSRLLNWASQALEQRDGHLVLSYPNGNNHPIQILRHDYKDIYQIPALVRPAQKRGGEKGSPNSDNFPEAAVYTFSQEINVLADGCLSSCDYALMRTVDYFKWRYAKRPDINYRICEMRMAGQLKAMLIWKYYPPHVPDRIMVVEWLSYADDESGSTVFEQLEDHADRNGLAIYIWQNVYQRLRHKLLEKRGYKLKEPIIYFGGFPLLNEEHIGPFNDYRNWYVSMGDVDIF